MSGPICVDPASDAVSEVMTALALAFDPTSTCPPNGGGSINVRFFAGEGPALAAFDAHTNEGGDCSEPFLWVRAARRFRTEKLPEVSLAPNPCRLPRAIEIEVGVGRCAVVEREPTWQDYAQEAEISLDDSWRIEMALCAAESRLRGQGYDVVTDEVTPLGPEGGVIAWTGIIYVQFAN